MGMMLVEDVLHTVGDPLGLPSHAQTAEPSLHMLNHHVIFGLFKLTCSLKNFEVDVFVFSFCSPPKSQF